MSPDQRTLRTTHSDELTPELRAQLTRLCEAAFEESFEHAWDRADDLLLVARWRGWL